MFNKEDLIDLNWLRNSYTFNKDSGLMYNIFGERVGFLCKKRRYYNIKLKGYNFRLHRVAWFLTHGVWPEHIDHINGNTEDNRMKNLRNCNAFVNNKNAKKRTDNTSGHVGVSYKSPIRKWQVSIYCNKKNIYLGVYKDKEEAIRVRKEAEIKYGFHPNHGRD